MGRIATWGLVGAVAVGVRVVRARHRRILHPKGCSFVGELDVWGPAGRQTGSDLVDHPGRHPVTVRISKGGGTPAGLPDVRGLAVRVHGPAPGARRDLLFSTAGTGAVLRHLPVPRWSFDRSYGSVLAYRTGGRPARKVYLSVVPDPGGPPLGRTLASAAAAAAEGAKLLVSADGVPFGRLTFGAALPATADAALAFDPVRNTTADLHPTGLVHASRAWAYRAAQRWRGTRPAPPDHAAVIRAAAHR
jgi:hypothetical protein